MFNVYIYISVALILRLSSSKACYGVNKSFGRTILILSGKLGIVSLFYTINISISDKFKLAVIKIFMKFVFFLSKDFMTKIMMKMIFMTKVTITKMMITNF